MSLTLAKKSLRMFEADESMSKKIKKSKKSKVISKSQNNDSKIEKLLMLGTSTLDDKICKNLLRSATKMKKVSKCYSHLNKKPTPDGAQHKEETVFTEDDFKNFEAELLQSGIN